MLNCYVEGTDKSVERMFKTMGFEITDYINNSNLVCLTGGSDISPQLYMQQNMSSYPNEQRDLREIGVYNYSLIHKIPIIGICRGAQLINVMAGGCMVQDISGHFMDHELVYKNRSYWCSSVHHQEMVPTKDCNFILRADDGIAEVVYYNHINALGFQGHPEYQSYGETTELFEKLMNEFLLG